MKARARPQIQPATTEGATSPNEGAPEAQAAWMAALVSSSNDAIIGKNLQGIVTSWNPAAERLFGYRAEEAVGRSILFLIPPSHRQEEGAILARISAGEHVEHYETVRACKDGRLVPVSLTVSPIKDLLGRIVGASKIARDISQRKESERHLEAAQTALIESERQVLAAADAERQRIGADLHDNLGQKLTAIELLCHSARVSIRNQPDIECQLREVCRFLRDAVTQTRRLARGLVPVPVNPEGLVDGLADLVREMSVGAVECRLICPFPVDITDGVVADHLFRIAQEAVNNATKHARTRRVTVTLSQQLDTVRLTIQDDGQGFQDSARLSSGVGLRIMRHRANAIGASLETRSVRGKGVMVTCALERRP